MTLFNLFALGTGIFGFTYLVAVLLGKEVFTATSRRARTVHIVVASVLLVLFLAQVILRFSELPLWLALFACAGLVSGVAAIFTRYPMPRTQADGQLDDSK